MPKETNIGQVGHESLPLCQQLQLIFMDQDQSWSIAGTWSQVASEITFNPLDLKMDKETLLEECRAGWLSVESDFKARLLKPDLLKYGMNA